MKSSLAQVRLHFPDWQGLPATGIRLGVLFGLLSWLVGCGRTPPAGAVMSGGGSVGWGRFQEVVPAAEIKGAYASYHGWREGTGQKGMFVVIWTDFDGSGALGTESGSFYDGNAISQDGRHKIEWKGETSDGRSGPITINAVTYDLANGSLFLVSTRGEQPQVLQLKRDTMKLKPGEESKRSLEDLARNDPDIAPFFAKGTTPK